MNQPKFKIFDRLVARNSTPFTVNKIECYGPSFIYSGVNDSMGNSEFDEHLLSLYQEPQKKKLYAFKKIGTSWVGFRSNDNEDADENMIRVPEYDIEYPTKEEK